MTRFELQEELWAMPEYRDLDPKRRKAATAHLIAGDSFGKACRAQGLNQSRERVGALAAVCRRFQDLYGPRGDDRALTIYEQAALLERQQAQEAPATDTAREFELSPPESELEPEPDKCLSCGSETTAASRLCAACDPEPQTVEVASLPQPVTSGSQCQLCGANTPRGQLICNDPACTGVVSW